MRTTLLLRWLAATLLFAVAWAAQGQEIRNRGEPLENVTTGGQPDVAALESLADTGYAAIIDLRRPEEARGIDEQAEVERLGMSYVSIPVDGANGVTLSLIHI